MEDCTTCEHSEFDPLWGEYKCVLKSRRVYDILTEKECADYKKAKEKKG